MKYLYDAWPELLTGVQLSELDAISRVKDGQKIIKEMLSELPPMLFISQDKCLPGAIIFDYIATEVGKRNPEVTQRVDSCEKCHEVYLRLAKLLREVLDGMEKIDHHLRRCRW